MSDETMKSGGGHGHDPIEEDELDDDPVTATHHDLPDPDGGGKAPEAVELLKAAARQRKRERESRLR